jgi:hypothetical protein
VVSLAARADVLFDHTASLRASVSDFRATRRGNDTFFSMHGWLCSLRPANHVPAGNGLYRSARQDTRIHRDSRAPDGRPRVSQRRSPTQRATDPTPSNGTPRVFRKCCSWTYDRCIAAACIDSR